MYQFYKILLISVISVICASNVFAQNDSILCELPDSSFQSSDNLMDYNGGEYLNHRQWQWAHEKHRNVLGFLDDEGESEAIADAVNALSDYEYAYIKKCSDEQNNNETLSTKVERYKVIGKKLSGENTIETINLNYEESGLVTFIAEDFTDAILIFDNGNLVNACEPAPPIDIDVCSISTIDDQSSLIEKIDAAVQNCLLSYLTEILQKLNAISSSNSIVEYTINNNSYRLVDGQILESALSKDDITDGNWSNANTEYIVRVKQDVDSVIQIESFGFYKNLPIAKGTADLPQLASDIKTTANKYLRNNNVKDLEQKPERTPDDIFPGNQKVELDRNSSCLRLVLKGVDITKEFLKTAEFEQDVYLSNSRAEIKLPAIATGTTESVARSVTDITSVVVFGYDMIFDDYVRHQTVEGLKVIKDQVVEDPSMLFPLLKDVALEEITGATSEQYTELVADNTDIGRRNHLSSKIAVRSVASLFAGGKVVAKLPEMSAKVAVKIADAKTFRRFANFVTDKEVLSVFKKRINDLPDGGKQFLEDFADATDDVLKKFVEKPELVEKWKSFKSNNVSKALRTDIDALENLNIETFIRSKWSNGGFESSLDSYLKKYNLSREQFEKLYRHPQKDVGGYNIEGHSAYKEDWLKDEDFEMLIELRNDIYMDNIPTNTTVFQKVICPDGEIIGWVENANRSQKVGIGGSTLIAKDAAHLNTPAKLYDGLQLNYRSTSYSKTEPMYVVRYTTNEAAKAKIPVNNLDAVPESIRKNCVAKPENKYPFTGNGFTPGTDGNLGTPELNVDVKKPEDVQIINQAVIIRIDVDGTETIVGYTLRNVDAGTNHFILKE